MSLKHIYVTRHGFRSNWIVDPKTGKYTTNIPTPTGIPSDPALASYGVEQSHDLADHLKNISPSIQRIYSSPFYRCIETITPTYKALLLKSGNEESNNLKVRGENGIGEWYGTARFDHPSPAEPAILKKFFPHLDENYQPYIRPNSNGESINQLHDRCAYTLHRIIEQCDKEGVNTILICTHAATYIAIGRVLTGRMPEDVTEEDFRPFTCSLSTFERTDLKDSNVKVQEWDGTGTQVPFVDWRNGKGVGGSPWQMTINSDCSYLSSGEERGWRFSGDESFIKSDPNSSLDAGNSLGVVIEGKKPEASSGASVL